MQDRESAESFARSIALRFLLRASPGHPSMDARRTHAFDPWTDYSVLRTSPLALLGAALRAFVAVARRRHGVPEKK